jgi:outer membrane protein TolC
VLPISDIEMPSDLEIAQITARDYNPDLRASFFAKRAAGYTINSRLGNHLPEVNLQGSVSTSRDPSPLLDQQDSASIGVVATMPLYEGGATTARVREARQTYNARVANNIATERDVVKRVTESWENWQSAKAEIEARQTQVKASAVAQFGARKESEFGARSLIDTLDTDQEYLEAQEDLLTAKRNEIVARYSLLSAMGMLTPSILGFADKVPNFQREIKQARRGF